METPTSTSPQPVTESCGPMFAPAQKEHAWLQKLVGTWTFESESVGEPGQPNSKQHGTESVKSIGDLWIIGEGQGDMPGGGTATMMITLGFNPVRNRFVGTWVGSMMSHLWVYDGELDASGRVLTLHSEGPSFTDPTKLAKYQDIIEVITDDHRSLTSRSRGEDGSWTPFMTAHYRRVKA
ncbi:MAG: DUF1579 domain-containing protein [Opitutaceae bacterium]